MSDKTPTPSSGFADRLVSLETLPADRKSELQQELHAMFEKKLTLFRRIVIAVVCLFALASSALCGYLAVTEHDLPLVGRVGLSIGTLCGLALVVVPIRILKRGAIDLRRDTNQFTGMLWITLLVSTILFLFGGLTMEDRLLGIMMIGLGLVFLIIGAVFLVVQRIEQSELATREKLLQIELMLAELRDKP